MVSASIQLHCPTRSTIRDARHLSGICETITWPRFLRPRPADPQPSGRMGWETPMTELAPQERPKRFPGLIAWSLLLLTLLAVVGAWFAFHPGFRWGQSGAHWA